MILELNNSYYDKQTHTRYPNIDYIKNQTGEDLMVLVGNELRAKAEIRNITDEIKAYLQKTKLRVTFNYMEYLTAKDKEYANEWCKIIASVIYAEYNMEKTRQEAIVDAINGSPLFSIERYTYKRYEYRGDY